MCEVKFLCRDRHETMYMLWRTCFHSIIVVDTLLLTLPYLYICSILQIALRLSSRPSAPHALETTSRGTRAAILGEAGDEQLQDDEGGFNTSSVASATPGIGSGHGGRGDGETRRVLSTGRTDRIARRQARNEASASGKGWPPPQMPNF